MFGEHKAYLTNIVVTLVAEKLIRKECEAYLAYVLYGNVNSNALNSILTVKDFLDVFS